MADERLVELQRQLVERFVQEHNPIRGRRGKKNGVTVRLFPGTRSSFHPYYAAWETF
jgi:hypothetical protein